MIILDLSTATNSNVIIALCLLLQISQLLETLQKEPQKLAVEGEKMAEFISSLTGEEGSFDSQTPSPKMNMAKDGPMSFQVPNLTLCSCEKLCSALSYS